MKTNAALSVKPGKPAHTPSASELRKSEDRRPIRVVKHFGGKHRTTHMSDGTTINVYEDGYKSPIEYVVDAQSKNGHND